MAKKASKQEDLFKEGSPFAYMNDKKSAWQRVSIAGVKIFLDHIYGMTRVNRGKTTDVEKLLYEETGRKYLDEKRDYVKDIKTWRDNSKMSPKSMRTYLSAVLEFLDVHGIVPDKEKFKKVKKDFKGGDEAPTDAPDHALIRSFLEHADVRLKSIGLVGASTGMRIGEILSITEKSISWDRRMITLKAVDTKTRTGRVVFFSKECERALTEYLKVKTKYIEENNKQVARFKQDRKAVDDGRVFPFSEVSINRSWNRTLKHAGQLQKNDWGYVTFHPHSLRKFFSVQLRRNQCPDSIVEFLLGHKIHLGMYTEYTPEILEEAYEKYGSILTIGAADDVRKSVAAIAEKSVELNSTIKKLEEEKEDLEKRVRESERRLAQIEQGKTGAADDKDIEEFKRFMSWKRSQKH
jgi:integrase